MNIVEPEHLGYRFRRRLEARWAHFFSVAGIPFIYEMEAFDLSKDGSGDFFQPSFWLPSLRVWLQVTDSEPTSEEVRKMESLLGGWDGEFEEQWAVAFGIGEPRYGDLRVYCFDSTDSSGGYLWWEECEWCHGPLGYKIMTQNGREDRGYFPESICSEHDGVDPEYHVLRIAAQCSRRLRFDQEAA